MRYMEATALHVSRCHSNFVSNTLGVTLGKPFTLFSETTVKNGQKVHIWISSTKQLVNKTFMGNKCIYERTVLLDSHTFRTGMEITIRLTCIRVELRFYLQLFDLKVSVTLSGLQSVRNGTSPRLVHLGCRE